MEATRPHKLRALKFYRPCVIEEIYFYFKFINAAFHSNLHGSISIFQLGIYETERFGCF